MEAERSKLLNRQRAEKQAALKDLKKKRGDLLDAAKKKYEELLERQEQELAEFDEKNNTGGKSAEKARKEREEAAAAASEPTSHGVVTANEDGILFKDMSKKELETECKARGISHKGSREDMIMRLLTSDAAPVKSQAKKKASSGPKRVVVSAPKKQQKEEDEEESESESESESENEEEEEEHEEKKEVPKELTPEEKAEKEEKERIKKRKAFLRQSLQRLVKENSDGVLGSDLADKLIEMGVLRDAAGLAPEKFGFGDMKDLLISFSPKTINYDDARDMIYPPSQEEEKKQNERSPHSTGTRGGRGGARGGARGGRGRGRGRK